MNIVIVTSKLASGGAERVTSVLANELVQQGHRLKIVTILGDDVKYKIDERIRYAPIIVKNQNKVLRVTERFILLRREIVEFKADVVFSLATENNIYSILSTMLLNIRVIVSERNDPNNDPKSKAVRKLRDIIYNFGKGFIFQTPEAMEYFNKRIQERSCVIPNPVVAIPFERKSMSERKGIVAACRLDEQKNLEMMIEAYANLSEKHLDVNLTIYGVGEKHADIVKLIEEKGLKDRVCLPGFSADLKREMNNYAVYLSTSSYEGISNSMLEAMALGLTVAVTDCPIGGSRLAVNNLKNGMLFGVNEMEGCVKALDYLLSRPDERERMGNNATKIVDEWSAAKIATKWVEFANNK